MKFELPFTEKTINEMIGKTMVLSDHNRNSSSFTPFLKVVVRGGGNFDGGYFKLNDGVLEMYDNQGLYCIYSSIETKNGVVYAVGHASNVVSAYGVSRVILHEQKLSMNNGDFGICISSFMKYAPTTLPIVLGSLRKAGFDMSAVVAVVGDFKGEKTEEIEGAKVFYESNNGFGFNGLSRITDSKKYWLLLHDTCEVERNFIDCVGNIDIGLNPDFISARPGEDFTGFYRTEFVKKIEEEVRMSPKSVGNKISYLANVTTVIPGSPIISVTKDVYGKGNRRVVEKSPLGIRKYKSLSKHVGL